MSYIKYTKPNEKAFNSASSESERYRHLTAPFLFGCGVDVASQGAAVVPWAISFDLPEAEFSRYANGAPPKGPIHLRGFADKLPFETGSLDFVYSSHFLEDVSDWVPVLAEWTRCIRIGGRLVILVPDKELWGKAILAGQPPNCEHRHESRAGELTEIFTQYFGHFQVERDSLTNVHPGDYTVMFVATRLR